LKKNELLPDKEGIMPERFVSEVIRPVLATGDTSHMAIGEPGLPCEFVWRGRTIKIAAVLRTWRETGKCRHGSPELYVRKHWFEVATTSNSTMKIYFDRQPRDRRKIDRWWLFTICESQE
jgi:phosphoribosylglycinamide formyltransferase-1